MTTGMQLVADRQKGREDGQGADRVRRDQGAGGRGGEPGEGVEGGAGEVGQRPQDAQEGASQLRRAARYMFSRLRREAFSPGKRL